MNQPRAFIRKFLKDNIEGGLELPRPGGQELLRGWFTTREILNGIIEHLRPDTEVAQISDTLVVLRQRGEVEVRKGANGNACYGYYRFVKDPPVPYCTGTVGLAPRHRDTAHIRELYRIRALARGHVVGSKKPVANTKKVKVKAPATPKGEPKRTQLGYKTADIKPVPPKPKFETYEQFLARGGKPEVLPPFQSVPRYIMCSPVDTRSESQRRGG